MESNIIPVDRLIPDSFPHLRCTFARTKGRSIVQRFHKPCVDPSQFPGTLTPGSTVPPRMRLLLAFVRTRTNGGVISVISHSSRLQTVCSDSCVPLYMSFLYVTNNIIHRCFLFYSLYALSRHVPTQVRDYVLAERSCSGMIYVTMCLRRPINL